MRDVSLTAYESIEAIKRHLEKKGPSQNNHAVMSLDQIISRILLIYCTNAILYDPNRESSSCQQPPNTFST